MFDSLTCQSCVVNDCKKNNTMFTIFASNFPALFMSLIDLIKTNLSVLRMGN